jgi:hypothetical protein
VSASVTKANLDVFNSGTMHAELNQTLIALIPKRKGLETLNHFRPISLCNTVYKIITKILVLRLKPLLPSLISPLQTAFVADRRGFDNVVIAQELIYTLERKKGKLGFMVIKIDLEKAYDRIEWSFVRQILIHFGFPDNITRIIMSCISTTSTSLLFNGGKLDQFLPSRGIRQGDLLSPFLFLLCMEYLGGLIEQKCDDGEWTKVKASCGGPGFSHVFFTDDLLLFAKANNKNCEAISNVLEEFCAMSVQKVSKSKSWVFFSPNVSSRNMQSICTKLGFSSTNSLGKYLGFPIMHKNRSHFEFNFLMEKVQERLAGWKTSLLSLASRLVLIKAAVTPIPEYIMQCAIIPAKVCNVVDKLCRDFLWGSMNEKRKLHMISWKTVTLPKHLGGLVYVIYGIEIKPSLQSSVGELQWSMILPGPV